jgi:hypothetical protein
MGWYCPKCDYYIREDGVSICPCGYDQKTGKAIASSFFSNKTKRIFSNIIYLFILGTGLDIVINHHLTWKTFMGPSRPATASETKFIGIWTIIVALVALISSNIKKHK